MNSCNVPDDYNDLLAKHYSLAYYRATLFISDPFLAEDATQDAMIAAWRHRHQFDPERGDFRAWLLTIVRNCCYSLLEKDRRRASLIPMVSLEQQLDSLDSEGSAEPSWLIDNRHTQDKLVEKHHFHRSLQRAMSRMKDYEREAFVMRAAGYKPAEIAEQSRVPIKTVNRRTRRARERLLAALDE